jgi:hypothetical protein
VLPIIASFISMQYFARGGGGGHGGGGVGGGGGIGGGVGGGAYGSNTGSGGWPVFIIFLAVLIIFFFLSSRGSKKKRSNTMRPAVPIDWPSPDAQQQVSDLFYAFQKDWANMNHDALQSYLSLEYFYNVNLMLLALRAAGRRNDMRNVRLLSAYPLAVIPAAAADEDHHTKMVVQMNGQADDSLMEVADGTTLYTDSDEFSEYWYFYLDGSTWRLDDIRQVTEAENDLSPAIQKFAADNKYFYSGEWGWLLLPIRGQLFSNASFMGSAVNNHVIGLYKTSIIEFYTYLPNKASRESYVVAQAFLPKTYTDIIVHHKQGFKSFKPSGLQKIEMEWPDFNKKYDVYATSMDQVTSFELLNPAFMEKVEALPFKLNIEVVDNVVYLFTQDTMDDYTPMLTILSDAFKEMRM